VPWGGGFSCRTAPPLVTERDSDRILTLGPDSGPDGLLVTPGADPERVAAGGDGGLMGIAVSPSYATDQTVFVYYSTAQVQPHRLGSSWCSATPPRWSTGIPHGQNDNGGGLAFGPDGIALRDHRRRGHPRPPLPTPRAWPAMCCGWPPDWQAGGG